MYDFFASLFGADNASTATWIAGFLALLVVLFLLWLFVRAIRRPRSADGRRSKHARLAVTDAAAIDPRRRLVLVRRDDVEHLIMIGGPTDIVIEQDIRRHTSARSLQTAEATPPAPKPVAPTPTPSKPKPSPAPVAAAKPVEPVTTPSVSKPSATRVEPAATPFVPKTDVSGDLSKAAAKVGSTVAAVGTVASQASAAPRVSAQSVEEPRADKPKASDDIEALLDEIAEPKK